MIENKGLSTEPLTPPSAILPWLSHVGLGSGQGLQNKAWLHGQLPQRELNQTEKAQETKQEDLKLLGLTGLTLKPGLTQASLPSAPYFSHRYLYFTLAKLLAKLLPGIDT